jgi:hypothetical protein
MIDKRERVPTQQAGGGHADRATTDGGPGASPRLGVWGARPPTEMTMIDKHEGVAAE